MTIINQNAGPSTNWAFPRKSIDYEAKHPFVVNSAGWLMSGPGGLDEWFFPYLSFSTKFFSPWLMCISFKKNSNLIKKYLVFFLYFFHASKKKSISRHKCACRNPQIEIVCWKNKQKVLCSIEKCKQTVVKTIICGLGTHMLEWLFRRTNKCSSFYTKCKFHSV